jgi:hypothetical protein
MVRVLLGVWVVQYGDPSGLILGVAQLARSNTPSRITTTLRFMDTSLFIAGGQAPVCLRFLVIIAGKDGKPDKRPRWA